MSNEELAIHIADGSKDLIGELYQQNKSLLYKHAYSFYILHRERCISAGVTLEDMMNECFFAVYAAAKSYAKGKREYKFTTYLNYTAKNYFRQITGMRTEKDRREPLNFCARLEAPIEGTEGRLTLSDTIEDITAADNEDNVIRRLSMNDVFPEVKRVLADKPRQYEILYSMFHDNMTQQAVAKMQGVSNQAIRQQKTDAFRKLRQQGSSKYLHSLYQDIICSSYNKGKLSLFKSTHTSSVEWAVLKAEEATQRMIDE